MRITDPLCGLPLRLRAPKRDALRGLAEGLIDPLRAGLAGRLGEASALLGAASAAGVSGAFAGTDTSKCLK